MKTDGKTWRRHWSYWPCIQCTCRGNDTKDALIKKKKPSELTRPTILARQPPIPISPFTPNSFGKAGKKSLQWIRVTHNKRATKSAYQHLVGCFFQCAHLWNLSKSLLLVRTFSSWDQTESLRCKLDIPTTQGLHQVRT